MPSPETQVMQCLEVWGGNAQVDTDIVIAGLDAWVYSRPYADSKSGGDLHYVSSCATGRITRLLLADVSGHGDGVSRIATGLRKLMQRYVNYIDQRSFVRRMNDDFTEGSEIGCFATAVVTSYFAPTQALTVSNAGHPPPAIYRARKRDWAWLAVEDSSSRTEMSNMPLGVMSATTYEQIHTTLQVGDLVLCYTDSLVDARDSDGSVLGQKGLMRVLQSVDISDPRGVIHGVIQAVAALHPMNLKNDDVTLLIFRANGLKPYANVKQYMGVPWRMLRGLACGLTGKRGIPWPEARRPKFVHHVPSDDEPST